MDEFVVSLDFHLPSNELIAGSSYERSTGFQAITHKRRHRHSNPNPLHSLLLSFPHLLNHHRRLLLSCRCFRRLRRHNHTASIIALSFYTPSFLSFPRNLICAAANGSVATRMF
ncbi:hypothetical protein HA466_0321400 [Hirschfeldia incana]|nr:hypothetical protein HA466_0321400 [Hirschfeldia incana]KAJ0228850.1 hypothetical protein HA466_0321400 [Hirschfeldia incana]